MKTINSLRSKLLALTLALMASVSIQAHDFSVDGIYYNILDGNNVEVTFKGSHVNQYVNEYINSINIPNEVTINNTTYTVTRVGDGAFYACRTLNSVTIPNSVTYIGDTAFYSCDDLTTVDVGNAVTRIGDGAFFRCSFLSSITIPNSVTRIGNRAFKYCYSMTSVNIGSSVTEIGEEAFDGCTVLNSVTIPNSVINIGAMAFQGCTYMTSVVIGNNVANIGNEAFRWCYSLTSVKCHNTTPPILGENIFEWGTLEMGPYELDTLYVPAESLNLYKEAEQWNLFNSILPIKETSYKDQWCNKWNILSHGYLGPQDPLAGARTSIYWLSNNTVNRSGQEYIPLMCSSSMPNEESTHLVGELRFTEDKQVYFYYDNTEYLLYDFDVQVGDTLDIFGGIELYSYSFVEQKTYPHVITKIDTLDDGRLQITSDAIVIFEDGEVGTFEEKQQQIWIEGLGSINGIVHTGINPGIAGNPAIVMLCAYRDDECVYKTDSNDPYWIDYTQLGCVYNEGDFIEGAFPILSGLQRTVCNEYCGDTEDDNSANFTYKQTFDSIFFENDKPYILYNGYLLREEDNKIFLYSQSLNKDIVLYDFTLEVGDSLPTYIKDFDGTMYSDDTLVVTDISSVTLLDGKEYKKWTFDNGMEYVEGIGMYGGHRNGNFFGLIQEIVVPCHTGTHLVCVSKNGKLLYQMDDAEMERLGAECLCQAENPEDLFPTLWGLQRTHTVEMYDYAPNDGKRSGGYPLPFASVKDTVINGKTYLQFGDYVNGSNYSLFFLREENNKVLIYSSILQNDLVLYDYTLELGDSLPAITSDHDYFSDDHFTKLDKAKDIFTYVVTNVSTVTLLDGIERKKWILKNKYLPIIEYVEGIGCYGENTSHSGDFFRLIYDHPYTTEYVGDHLVCVSKNGQLLYSMPQEEMNSFTLTCECLSQEDTIAPKDLFPTLWGLQRTSCSEYVDCQENETYLMQADEIKEINGKQYLKYGGVFLREEDSKVLIYSFPYEKDFVLYDWTLGIGDTLQILGIDPFSFPELEYTAVVDYVAFEEYDANGNRTIVKKPLGNKRVKDISTMRLLDGNEYKAWLFGYDWERGNYYVEGIGNASKYGGDYVDLVCPFEVPSCYYGERLVCVSRDGILLYQIDDAEMERLGTECLCEYNSGPKKDNAKNGKIGGRPTPTQWNMLEVETKEIDGTPTILRAETFSYTLENDSIVTKGKTFYQLARQSTKDTAITKSFVGALHFGEDEDNRVYYLRDGVEYVLYDFTAEIGDTVEIFAGINNYPHDSVYTHVVTGKDTLENGACRMLLEVVFPEETNATATHAEKIWLAGLGSVDGIVHNAAKRTSNAHAAPARSAHSSETESSVMLCAWREDSCLYTTNHPDYETFGCVYNQDPTAVESPTSSSSYQKVLRGGQLLIMHNGKTYTVMGIEMK